jgi:co-chaperonin GroES (HSP10)
MSLPKVYDEVKPKFAIPETPFTEMTSGHICVIAEGFKYQGLIEIPKSAQRNSTAGFVVDAAKDSKYKRGDKILYSQFAGYMFFFKGAAGMRVMNETEVLGYLKQDAEVESSD